MNLMLIAISIMGLVACAQAPEPEPKQPVTDNPRYVGELLHECHWVDLELFCPEPK